MDQPVVLLERLPEKVIQKYLKKEMKVLQPNYDSKFFQSKNFIRKKPYWSKRDHNSDSLSSKFYKHPASSFQSGYKVTANGCLNNFHECWNNNQIDYEGRTVHLKKVESDLVDSHQLHSCNDPSSQVSSELENIKYFSHKRVRINNAKLISNELKHRKKRCLSGEKKVTNKDLAHSVQHEENIDNCNENTVQCEELDSCDWQIVSEASCSDVSRDSSPSRENLLDAEHLVHTKGEEKVMSKQTNLAEPYVKPMDSTSTMLSRWQDIMCSSTEKLNPAHESDEDDKITEPYRSECEEDIDNEMEKDLKISKSKPSIRIKLAGSHKKGFTNITDESDKERLKKMDSKTVLIAEPCVLSEGNSNKMSSILSNEITVANNLSNGQSSDHKDSVNNHCAIDKCNGESMNVVDSLLCSNDLESNKDETSSDFTNDLKKSKRDALPLENNVHYDNCELKNVNSDNAQVVKKESSGKKDKQLGQVLSNSEKSAPKFNRYDYVGLIMKTMDKTVPVPYSGAAKSDDIAQNPNANEENQTHAHKLNNINKANYKENPLSGKKELPAIPCFKQKKARMSRVTSVPKSFLCKDTKGTTTNKVEFGGMASRRNDVEPKSKPIIDEHMKVNGISEKSWRKPNVINKAMISSSKVPNTQILSVKQGAIALGAKAVRRCWRCGKQFGNSCNVSDRLCKQCNSFDYTLETQKLSNSHLNRNCSGNDDTFKDVATPKLVSSSDTYPTKTQFQTSFNHNWGNKSNLSEKQNASNPEWNKNIENFGAFQTKCTPLTIPATEKKTTNIQTENANISPLKLVVSIGSNKLVDKTTKDKAVVGDIQSKKLKKKRMRSSSDTVEGIYEVDKYSSAIAEQVSGRSLLCKIAKKRRKHKDLTKRKKKLKLETGDGGSDISDSGRNHSSDDADHSVSGYHSEDNIMLKSKSSSIFNEHSELPLDQPAENQIEKPIDDKNDSHNHSSVSKKGNCEVRNVNKGLFLLSFSETDEELYQFQSGLCKSPKSQNNQTTSTEVSTLCLDTVEQSKDNFILPKEANLLHQQVETNTLQKMPSDSAISGSVCEIKSSSIDSSCPTLSELQELVDASDTLPSQESETLSSDENKTESNKTVSQSECHVVCEEDNSKNRSSMLRIESVYSLKDAKSDSDNKRITEVKKLFLFNHNIHNELDAYTTASILDMDGTKERSLTVLMSLLSREYKELQYINQAAKKAETVDVELQNDKLRHIDNIRTLQLACALFKQCQKCNKELSPEMLNLKREEIILLLKECGSSTNIESQVTEEFSFHKDGFCLKLRTNDKQNENKPVDNNSVKNHISEETRISDKCVMHTTNTRKTVKFLLDQQKKLESSSFNSTRPMVESGAVSVKRKSDDDVICLGVSHLNRPNAQNLQPFDQRTIPLNGSTNSIEFPEAIGNKKDNQGTNSISPNLAPPNVSVIKSHGLATPPAIQSFIVPSSTANSLALQQAISGIVGNPSLRVSANIATSAAAYQKTAVGYAKHPSYSIPSNSLSIQKDTNDNAKQPHIIPQLGSLPNGTTWMQNGIQNQWSSQPSSDILTTLRNQTWRNTSPIQPSTPPSVPNQQKSVQQMPVTNQMLPHINQYGTAVTGHMVHGGLSAQATRNLPPPMYGQPSGRTWHQPNTLNATLRPAQQTPVVCIACRKPIGMTCPTGMFCSDYCKKSYCARFPNYR